MTPSDPFDLKPKTIEDHNRHAEQALAFFLRDFPQTYRLLAGSRFQVPVPRQADYMNYAHSIYGDAWTFIRATPCRAGRWWQGDRDAWRQVSGEFTVVNEWLKPFAPAFSRKLFAGPYAMVWRHFFPDAIGSEK